MGCTLAQEVSPAFVFEGTFGVDTWMHIGSTDVNILVCASVTIAHT